MAIDLKLDFADAQPLVERFEAEENENRLEDGNPTVCEIFKGGIKIGEAVIDDEQARTFLKQQEDLSRAQFDISLHRFQLATNTDFLGDIESDPSLARYFLNLEGVYGATYTNFGEFFRHQKITRDEAIWLIKIARSVQDRFPNISDEDLSYFNGAVYYARQQGILLEVSETIPTMKDFQITINYEGSIPPEIRRMSLKDLANHVYQMDAVAHYARLIQEKLPKAAKGFETLGDYLAGPLLTWRFLQSGDLFTIKLPLCNMDFGKHSTGGELGSQIHVAAAYDRQDNVLWTDHIPFESFLEVAPDNTSIFSPACSLIHESDHAWQDLWKRRLPLGVLEAQGYVTETLYLVLQGKGEQIEKKLAKRDAKMGEDARTRTSIANIRRFLGDPIVEEIKRIFSEDAHYQWEAYLLVRDTILPALQEGRKIDPQSLSKVALAYAISRDFDRFLPFFESPTYLAAMGQLEMLAQVHRMSPQNSAEVEVIGVYDKGGGLQAFRSVKVNLPHQFDAYEAEITAIAKGMSGLATLVVAEGDDRATVAFAEKSDRVVQQTLGFMIYAWKTGKKNPAEMRQFFREVFVPLFVEKFNTSVGMASDLGAPFIHYVEAPGPENP